MLKYKWIMAWTIGLLVTSSAAAQTPPTRKVFTNRLAFSLPVRIDDRDKAELRELRFYAKPMIGGTPGDWQCIETAPPSKARFQYQAPQDGEYWFAFATVDRFGKVSPSDLDREPPGLVVVVDTKAPDVEVQKLVVASGDSYLQCQIKDPNPDYSKIKLEALMPDRSVRLLEPLEEAPGLFRIPDPSVLKCVVRATSLDKAGNRAVREVDLNPTSAPAPLPLTAQANALPTVPSPIVPASIQDIRPNDRVEPAVAHVPATPMLPPPGRQLVNSLQCSLDYALDTPNVVRVEAFATRDGGRSWARLGDDPDRRSPIEFSLTDDGVYGISLVVGTSMRPGQPPVTGDTPDCWIEVDSTRPVVHVSDVKALSGDEAGLLQVTWSCQDRNLAAEPCDILIASQPEGPWLPLARNQKPEGVGKFSLPRDVGWKAFVRLEARDMAGNSGRWETRDAVALDAGKAKARVLGVTGKK
jgi:hypothetical protein